MLTTKLLRSTFGARIEPYGFKYKGFKHRRWIFSIELDNRTRKMEKKMQYHSIVRKTDEELEDLLNTLGDHFV